MYNVWWLVDQGEAPSGPPTPFLAGKMTMNASTIETCRQKARDFIRAGLINTSEDKTWNPSVSIVRIEDY